MNGYPSVNKRKRWKGSLNIPWIVVVPGVIVAFASHFAAPLAGAFYAFTNWRGMGSFQFIGLDNFKEIFATPAERMAILNTFRIAVSFLILVNVGGLLLALGLNKQLKTKNFLRALFFLPAIMTPLSVTQIWRYILDYDGPLNKILKSIGLEALRRNWIGDVNWALLSILLVLVWQYIGYAMIIYHAGLQSIPNVLYEASGVDGASAWRQFWSITFPLLAPAVTIVTTLMTIMGLRVFDQVLGLTGGGPAGVTETLASDFYTQTWVNMRYGYGTELALLLTVLVVGIGVLQVIVLRKREEY
jgi:raffinose/stachyose/melibiose transport system permease protein